MIESNIVFSKDIIKKVSENTGYSEKQVSVHLDFFVNWIKHLTNKEDVLSIFIPHIGILYLNWVKTAVELSHIESLPESMRSENMSSILSKNSNKIEAFKREFPNNNFYNRHKKRFKITSNHFNNGKSLLELEEWQNKQ